MESVNKEIYDLAIELQSFAFLESFALAGGTSLAIRYNHRISVDIDLFTDQIVGQNGLEEIKKGLKNHYQNSLRFCEVINTQSGNQYCFLRALINKDGEHIKVEMIQNIQRMEPLEVYRGIKILSVKDIALLKLLSASSRKAKKDIYDLDLITDTISLESLMDLLEKKQQRFDKEEHKNLFDIDDDPSPSGNLALLLEFDNTDYSSQSSRPSHSNDRVDITPSGKSWLSAKASWRKKVITLMGKKGLSLPDVKPID